MKHKINQSVYIIDNSEDDDSESCSVIIASSNHGTICTVTTGYEFDSSGFGKVYKLNTKCKNLLLKMNNSYDICNWLLLHGKSFMDMEIQGEVYK